MIRFPLLLTVYFRAHVEPGRMRRFLREHELLHVRRLERYERHVRRVPEEMTGPLLTLRFGIEYERAVLRWFASIPGYDPLRQDAPAT